MGEPTLVDIAAIGQTLRVECERLLRGKDDVVAAQRAERRAWRWLYWTAAVWNLGTLACAIAATLKWVLS